MYQVPVYAVYGGIVIDITAVSSSCCRTLRNGDDKSYRYLLDVIVSFKRIESGLTIDDNKQQSTVRPVFTITRERFVFV